MQDKIGDMLGIESLQPSFSRREAMTKKAAGHSDVLFRTGLHKCSLFDEKASVFLFEHLNVVARQ
jgi:hypothetical protein